MTMSPSIGPKGKGSLSFWRRHWEALGYVLTVILPTIFRTGRRPVIFSKYSGIGDIVCTFPAALELKKRHPGAEFIYNCHPDYASLPRLGGITSRTTSLAPIGLIGYWYRFLVAGFYQFSSDDDRPDRNHADIYIKDFGRDFGVVLDGEHSRLRPEPSVVARIKAMLEKSGLRDGPLVVFHTGPSWPVKEWSLEAWADLVKKLQLQGYGRIVRVGTSKHLAMGEMVMKEIPCSYSLVNQLDLEESAALIDLADLFIGIDSGLLHIAAAVGTPAVGLWGATSPQFLFSTANQRLFVVSEAECQGCHHRLPRLHWVTGCPFDIKCMKEIKVNDVLQMCEAGLKDWHPEIL